MDWFRRALFQDNIKAATADPSKANVPPSSKKQSRLQNSDLEEHGIADKLVDLVRTFTVDTFESLPLQDDGDEPGRDIESDATAAENAKRVLSYGKRGMTVLCWLESSSNLWIHLAVSVIMILNVELAQLRYVLCPRQMKELKFCEIFFMLVWSHLAEYELRARKLAKPNEMKIGGGETSEGNGFEVEMSEAMPSSAQEPAL